MCFDAHLPHSYAPDHVLEVGELAPQILITVTANRHDREMRKVETAMPRPKVKGGVKKPQP